MDLKVKFYNLLCEKSISALKKSKFYSFGKNSKIEKPYLQLSGVHGISIGNNVTILKHARLAVYGAKCRNVITIGDGCYIGFGFSALADFNSTLTIGSDVLIASNVLITNENHSINPEDNVSYMDQPLSSKSVLIDDGCWIGEQVCILPGVTIGKKCIIGAGSVVTKSIPAYSIAVGNPAKVIKRYNFNIKKWENINEK